MLKYLNCLKDLVTCIAIELLKPLKFSFILGSKIAFFSLAQCTSPLVGVYGGISSVAITFAIRTIYTFLTLGAFYTSLLYHIPTFCGAWYLCSNSKLAKIALPLICIMLFVSHPTGSQAALYATYWLIPIVLVILNTQSFFLKALASTFTVHAVGSVIWLYTKQIDANTWNYLINIVWAERLIFAVCMTAIYYAVNYSKIIYSENIKQKLGIIPVPMR